MKGGGYCREGLGGTGRLQWVFYGQSEGATSQIGVWGQLPNGLTAGRKRFLCQLSANLHWYRPDRLPEIFRKARLRLGRVFVTVVIRRRPYALLRPDVGVPSLLDEPPALGEAVAERLRILAVVGKVGELLNVEHME